MGIKDLRADERPREKMLARGAGSLSDGELVAVLLHSGSRDRSALDLARQLLDLADGRLCVLFNLPRDKMLSLPGIGPGKAASVLAALELGRRFLQEQSSVVKRPILTARQARESMFRTSDLVRQARDLAFRTTKPVRQARKVAFRATQPVRKELKPASRGSDLVRQAPKPVFRAGATARQP